jgi:hypothetical protein
MLDYAFNHKTYFDIIKEIGSHALMADMTEGMFKDSHTKTMKKYIKVATKLHNNMIKKWGWKTKLGYNSVEEITLKQVRTELYRVYKDEILPDFIRISGSSVMYYSPEEVKRKCKAETLHKWLNEKE